MIVSPVAKEPCTFERTTTPWVAVPPTPGVVQLTGVIPSSLYKYQFTLPLSLTVNVPPVVTTESIAQELPTPAIVICCPSCNWWVVAIWTSAGFDWVILLIVTVSAVEIPWTTPVAPEVPPVTVSPVVNDVASKIFKWENISISNR